MLLVAEPYQSAVKSAILVAQRCAGAGLQVSADQTWLKYAISGDTVTVWASGKPAGRYSANLTIRSASAPEPLTIPVTLWVVDHLYNLHLPFLNP
jgi:hypothetical protein